MQKLFGTCVAIIACVVLLQVGTDARLQQSTIGIPTTLEELIEQSDMVILGEVVAVGTPSIRSSRGMGPDAVFRGQSVRIIETLKRDERHASKAPVTVVQRGGSATKDGRVVSSEYSSEQILRKGQKVVLFLLRGKTDGEYWIFGGAGGLWPIVERDGSAVVTLPKAARSMQAFAGRDWQVSDVLELLRQRGGK